MCEFVEGNPGIVGINIEDVAEEWDAARLRDGERHCIVSLVEINTRGVCLAAVLYSGVDGLEEFCAQAEMKTITHEGTPEDLRRHV